MKRQSHFIGIFVLTLSLCGCEANNSFIPFDNNSRESVIVSNSSSINTTSSEFTGPAYYMDVGTFDSESNEIVDYKNPTFVFILFSGIDSNSYIFNDGNIGYVISSCFDNIPLTHRTETRSMSKEFINESTGINNVEIQVTYNYRLDGKNKGTVLFTVSPEGVLYFLDYSTNYYYYSEPNAINQDEFKNYVLEMYDLYGFKYEPQIGRGSTSDGSVFDHSNCYNNRYIKKTPYQLL